MLNRVAFLFVKNALDLWYGGYFFKNQKYSQNSKKTKRRKKDEIKMQLIESIIINNAS